MAKLVQLKDKDGLVYPKINRDFIIMSKLNTVEPLDWGGDTSWVIFGSQTTYKQSGTSLTRNDNDIIVGKGVKKVRVTAQVTAQINNWSENDWLFLQVAKNGVSVCKAITSELKWVTLQTTTIVDVVEGDKLAYYVRCKVPKSFLFYNYYASFGNNPMCFLMVEVIE